jgi:hypothetical protein
MTDAELDVLIEELYTEASRWSNAGIIPKLEHLKAILELERLIHEMAYDRILRSNGAGRQGSRSNSSQSEEPE